MATESKSMDGTRVEYRPGQEFRIFLGYRLYRDFGFPRNFLCTIDYSINAMRQCRRTFFRFFSFPRRQRFDVAKSESRRQC